MKLDKLFTAQKELDDRIVKDKELQGHDLVDNKILALQVEISELANELPEVFKFWSNKKNNYDNALIEYVDILHFALSIGNDLEINRINIPDVFGEFSTQEIFQNLFRFSSLLNDNKDENSYKILFIFLLNLGERLGFTEDKIVDAYFSKNEENHERQVTGY